ncbi:MAG: hypothetical protein JXB23_13800, partial [Candidatus Aminicenantes bacterium]|nr:hypothetical protein [Candidatus Aminicenantes bacterium]
KRVSYGAGRSMPMGYQLEDKRRGIYVVSHTWNYSLHQMMNIAEQEVRSLNNPDGVKSCFERNNRERG